MFKKEDGGAKKDETIIGPSVKVEGTFVGEGDVLVEGEFSGELKTKGKLTVAQSARLEANIEANEMLVSGSIKGNVKCHGSLELTAQGKIWGDVEVGVLSVENGATICGKCTVGEKPATERIEKRDGKK